MKDNAESILLCKDILSFRLDDELLLFNPASQDFILLNPTSALIWQGLNEGFSIGQIVDTLADVSKVRKEQLKADIEPILDQWAQMGFFSPGSAPGKTQENDTSACKQGARKDPASCSSFWDRFKLRLRFALLTTTFDLYLNDEALYHLVRDHVRQLVVQEEKTADICLSLDFRQNQYEIGVYDRRIAVCRERERVIPILHAHMMMAAYQRSNCMIGLHAASVAWENRNILLPAPAGSGKSTLVAGLMRSGFQFGADDLVLLDAHPGNIRPVPTPIGLKKGSWPVLEGLFPELKKAATHLREDGQHIRYLIPDSDQRALPSRTPPQSVDCIIYPAFNDSGNNQLERITPAQSLVFLSRAGFDIKRKLTPDNVVELVHWIKHIPSYRLSFTRLEKAVALLKKWASQSGRSRIRSSTME